MSTPSALEQDVLNVVSLASQAAAALVSANNPKYSSIISTISSLSYTAQASLGVPSVTSTLPVDLVANVAPTISAVNTLTSKTATAAQKAAALTTALQSVTVVAEDVWSFISGYFTHPSAVVPSAVPTPVASTSTTT